MISHLYRARRFVVTACIAVTMVLCLSNYGPASAWGERGIPVTPRASLGPGYPCNTIYPPQATSHQDLTARATHTICNMYASITTTAHSLFAGNSGLAYLPWAPMLVGLVLICFLVLGGWCSWKMRGYRPRRKVNIGRVI